MVKYTGRGLVVKRLGVLSKVQMLTLVLGVGVFSLLPSSFSNMILLCQNIMCNNFVADGIQKINGFDANPPRKFS